MRYFPMKADYANGGEVRGLDCVDGRPPSTWRARVWKVIHVTEAVRRADENGP
jgi:hypothetical protein